MKQFMYAALLLAAVVGCRKEKTTISVGEVPQWEDMQAFVQQEMHDSDQLRLDWSNKTIHHQPGNRYGRIPFRVSHPGESVVLVRWDSTRQKWTGKIIRLQKLSAEGEAYRGELHWTSLDRSIAERSTITNGYVDTWHQRKSNLRVESQPYDPYEYLPEVVVVGYRNSGSGISWRDMMNLQQMMDGGMNGDGAINDGGGSNMYSPVSGGGGSGDTGGSVPGLPYNDISIDFNQLAAKPAIDITAWLRCFRNMPDAGAECNVTICADLPVNDNPELAVDIYSGATGHCFLELSKTVNGQTITQTIGFTAQNAWHALQNPLNWVPGKLVDNAGHEYNASLTVPLTPRGFELVLAQLEQRAQSPYSIMLHDCLDFALLSVNAARGTDPLQLPFNPQSNDPADHISTAQRFYYYLEDKLMRNDADAPFIRMDFSLKGTTSHGPCN